MSKVNSEISEKKIGHTHIQWMTAILAATTLLNYGLHAGWISPMTKILQSESSVIGRPLSDIEMSWIASTLLITAVFGVFLHAYIADMYGRKATVIAIAVPQAMCWAIKLASPTTTALVIARVCAGIGAGGCFNVIPMYIKEISQDNIRGTTVSLSMMFQNIGLMVMYSMGAYLDYYSVLWIAFSISLVSIALFVLIAPESPAYLVKKGKVEEAVKTISRLRGLDVDDNIVQSELEEMKSEEKHFSTTEHITFLGILRNKAWCRALILCSLLMAALDLNGYYTIFTFAWKIMTEAGVTVNTDLQTLSIPIIMIIGSMVAMACVDKLGRKLLLAGGFMITTVSISCLATILLLQQNGVQIASWMPVAAIVAIVWAYAAGILPAIYVVISEVFNFQVRSKLIGCIVTLGWFLSFVQLALYGAITVLGLHTMFYIFAGVNLIGALITLFFLPETKGKSVEEIEQMLIGRKLK